MRVEAAQRVYRDDEGNVHAEIFITDDDNPTAEELTLAINDQVQLLVLNLRGELLGRPQG